MGQKTFEKKFEKIAWQQHHLIATTDFDTGKKQIICFVRSNTSEFLDNRARHQSAFAVFMAKKQQNVINFWPWISYRASSGFKAKKMLLKNKK